MTEESSNPDKFELKEVVAGKLHINYMENDILIHCTDNPGRVTILRTSVQQKQKLNPGLSFVEAYDLCCQDLVLMCEKNSVYQLYVKVKSKRDDGIVLLDKIIRMVVEHSIYVHPVTDLPSQPSSKTRRLCNGNRKRRYQKNSYSQDTINEMKSWRNNEK